MSLLTKKTIYCNIEQISITKVNKIEDMLGDGAISFQVPDVSFDDIAGHDEVKNRLKEIANFLTKVGEGRLSESSSRSIRALFKMIDDIESIADSCVNILNSIERKRAQKIVFPEQINNNVHLLFSMVRGSLDLMVTMLTHKEEISLSLAKDTENEINNFRDILKSEHLNNLEKGIYKYDAGIIYNDIISQCERIGDFAMNVDESFKNIY